MKNSLLRLITVLACCYVTGNGFSQNLLNGLQACYPLDCPSSSVISNAATTGTLLDGILVGSVTCTSGRFNTPNTALHFGGTTADYILLPASPLIKPTTSLSVSGWFRFDSYIHSDLIFTRNTCTGNNFNMNNLIWDAGQIMLAKRPGASTGCAAGAILTTNLSALLPLNTWHHIVYYVDDLTLAVTINNGATFVLSHNVAFDYDAMKEVVLGGTDETAANNPFLGSMDELRFYNRKLTPAEITLLYNTVTGCEQSGNAADFATPSVVCAGALVTFTNQSNQGGNSFLWNMPGGNPSTSSATHASVVYNVPGTYAISLTSSSTGGSSVSITHTIQVEACTILPDETQEENIQCYPNPATTNLWLIAQDLRHIVVRDVSGKEVFVEVTHEDKNKFHMDLSHVTPGLYFIEFETKGRVQSRKVVVSN